MQCFMKCLHEFFIKVLIIFFNKLEYITNKYASKYIKKFIFELLIEIQFVIQLCPINKIFNHLHLIFYKIKIFICTLFYH